MILPGTYLIEKHLFSQKTPPIITSMQQSTKTT